MMPEFKEGMTVEVNDGETVTKGVISGVFEKPVEWPTEEGDDRTIEASPENPLYIIGLLSGGSKPFREDEIVQSKLPGDEMDEQEAKERVKELMNTADLGEAYWRANEPEELESFRQAVDETIRANYVTELSQCPGTSDMYATELVNIPGVDDPHVGFDEWPDSWEESEQPPRLILLKAWASMGGTWRSCFGELSSEMTPRKARRMCSAYKDEVYGTEEWRGFA